jgi:cell wall-associated NlpC family hydrolase
MSRAPGVWGVVSLASLDLRRRPDHRSELRSQLLMGEVVRRLSTDRRKAWWEVENRADRYRGWARAWGLIEVTAARAARWRRKATGRVIRAYDEVREGPGRGALVTPLVWQDRLIPGTRRGRYRRVELPDGRQGWVEATALEVGRPRRRPMVARIRSLLGVPYLWGGRTPLGLDCSGFTQQVLAEQGIQLPRDADQQYRVSRPIGRDAMPREGDLVFFGRSGRPLEHVGIVLGGGYFAHARGRVQIGSLASSNPLYDRPLAAQLRGFRRPRKGPPRGPR